MKKKILILGNSWHGRWSIGVHEEIMALGYQSEHVDVWHRSRSKIQGIDSFLKKLYFNKLSDYILKKIDSEPIDRCIVMTPYTLPASIWRKIKEKNVKLIGWWGDSPMRKGNLGESMGYFDQIYLVDENWVNTAKYFNPETFYLPHGSSSKYFFPTNKPIKNKDVVFVGDSFGGNMDGQYRSKVLQTLIKEDIKLSIFGDNNWSNITKLKSAYKGPVLTSKKLNNIYNDSKIVLNLHHSQFISGTNQRTFETASAGSFQISDYKQSINQYFDGLIPTFSSASELIKIIHHFLNNEEEREEKAKLAHNLASSNHSLEKRIKVILES